ncbi:MAG TPA: hypothetical protein VE545_04360 [Candidatus Dormibacteraeota bacterium]|nr:hypothetical protein [Candidatus Dormibacteraeota bacterium]
MAGNLVPKSDGRYKPSGATGRRPTSGYDQDAGAACTTTISVEFVAKPNESHRVHSLVPAAIASTLEGAAGFAGCAVMVSNMEERLVTVLTFWEGDLSVQAASTNSRWVCKLIERYIDHRLRVQTMRTQMAFSAPKSAARRACHEARNAAPNAAVA